MLGVTRLALEPKWRRAYAGGRVRGRTRGAWDKQLKRFKHGVKTNPSTTVLKGGSHPPKGRQIKQMGHTILPYIWI